MQAELAESETELRKYTAEKERLAERVATQGISAVDVQRMNEEKGALQEKLKYVSLSFSLSLSLLLASLFFLYFCLELTLLHYHYHSYSSTAAAAGTTQA